jgi:hypothetical protein
MIRGLEALDYNKIRPNIFTIELPKPPIKTQLPIFQMHYACNLRNDIGDALWIANNWRLVPTLRHLKNSGVRGPMYQWVDCPSYLTVHDRHNFLKILDAYRSEFEIITSCEKYKEDLNNLGCMVSNYMIDNYDHKELSLFIDNIVEDAIKARDVYEKQMVGEFGLTNQDVIQSN